MRVAQGACIEQHGPREAYMPVLAALEALVRREAADDLRDLLRHIAPTWLAQMPWLISADDERALRQSLQAVLPERMLREFAALVEALTRDTMLVLVLEDLHWSDVSTVDLLTVLAQRRAACSPAADRDPTSCRGDRARASSRAKPRWQRSSR